MKILVLGGDGYLGWPTAMHLANLGHDILVVDNYCRRMLAEDTDSLPLFDTPNLAGRCKLFKSKFGKNIDYRIGDLGNSAFTFEVFSDFMPDTIIHYAEQPSAPYSMRGFSEAQFTLQNNLNVTFNIIWAMINIVPQSHMIKLGTMGEYGTPNIDIEEGWIDIESGGRKHKFLYPRAASSLYHTTKVLDTDLIWFYVRTYGLRVTDLMQGPVYGIFTNETRRDVRLFPNFNYDDIFGTVLNRFIVQAVAGIPLTVYGKGNQVRGYLNLVDTLRCVELSASTIPENGELKIYNQFTETFTVNKLAEMVKSSAQTLGLQVDIKRVQNPRKEMEDHYYNPKSTKLKSLGLEPTLLTQEVIVDLLGSVINKKDDINISSILPRVSWSK